jgi:hypothetical protein
MASQKRTSEAYLQYIQNLYKWKKKIKEQEKELSEDGSLAASVGYKDYKFERIIRLI